VLREQPAGSGRRLSQQAFFGMNTCPVRLLDQTTAATIRSAVFIS
jgi:hypothetical protein